MGDGGGGGGPVSDREQWVRLAVARYGDALARYAARLVGDEDRGRDVVQETFLRLWDADPAAVNGHLVEWLYTVTRRRAIDLRRKDGRMQTLDEQAVAMKFESGGAGPTEVVETRDTAAAAMRVIARLPEAQQEVVRLKFQHGLSYREIAKVTGHSESNVGFLLHTALKAVRERMNA